MNPIHTSTSHPFPWLSHNSIWFGVGRKRQDQVRGCDPFVGIFWKVKTSFPVKIYQDRNGGVLHTPFVDLSRLHPSLTRQGLQDMTDSGNLPWVCLVWKNVSVGDGLRRMSRGRCTVFSWVDLICVTLSNSTDNIVCTSSFWWRVEGWWSWCFHPRNDEVFSNNFDRNICWWCDRQKYRTPHIQGACLVRVQGLRCHVLSVCMWTLLVYRGMDSLWRRNKLHQTLVENLVREHTNLLLSDSLDDALYHLVPCDIEFIIDEPVDEFKEEPEV